MEVMKRIIILSVIAAASASSLAEDVPTEKKAEFRKLVIERNQMHKELQKLDMQAAGLMKQGKDITRVNSEQVTIEDRLDLNQLRLETMAARYDLVIPNIPDLTKKNKDKKSKDIYGADAFERGKARTLLELRRQTFVLLRNIDYSIILARLEEK